MRRAAVEESDSGEEEDGDDEWNWACDISFFKKSLIWVEI